MGDSANSDTTSAKTFMEEFANFIESKGYILHQVFNCDETDLFWKKMPNTTYITQDERTMPWYKPMEDRVPHLLCHIIIATFC